MFLSNLESWPMPIPLINQNIIGWKNDKILQISTSNVGLIVRSTNINFQYFCMKKKLYFTICSQTSCPNHIYRYEDHVFLGMPRRKNGPQIVTIIILSYFSFLLNHEKNLKLTCIIHLTSYNIHSFNYIFPSSNSTKQ